MGWMGGGSWDWAEGPEGGPGGGGPEVEGEIKNREKDQLYWAGHNAAFLPGGKSGGLAWALGMGRGAPGWVSEMGRGAPG